MKEAGGWSTVGAGPGRKPPWLKKAIPEAAALRRMQRLLRSSHLHSVCESALCPNLGECFARGTATFLILGDVCTRDCRFCGVTSGRPQAADQAEPQRVAEAAARLGLRHVVVTSVTRDDLPDGGAGLYVDTIRALRAACPDVTIEVLIPDFGGEGAALDKVLAEAPEVLNHNLETVPRLYERVRPEAEFERSLELLRRAVESGRSLVKTGWMVGLGENEPEVVGLLDMMSGVGLDIVTIGQYLQPSKRHLPVEEYVAPEVFERYSAHGETIGLQVYAGSFVRSSFRAEEGYARAADRDGRARTVL